jgi:hypothetical protein
MKMKRFRQKKRAPLAITVLALLGIIGLSFDSSQAAPPWKVSNVEMPGVNGGSNNVAFAFDRYALVAPYAPSTKIDENSSISDLTNHYIYLVDTKKPTAGVIAASLETLSGNKTVYYPTSVLFDPNSRIVYVRGTRFEARESGEVAIEVIAYLRLNLDENGKAVFNPNVTVIDIKGIGSDEHCSDAPNDIALGQNGRLLVFTNGASIFSYNVDLGYVYQVEIIPEKDFNEDSKISYLNIDEASDIVTVCWNGKVKGDDGALRTTSELSFYRLHSDGVLPLVKRVYPEQFADNAFLVEGSSVAIGSSGDKGDSLSAFFICNDGALCQVDLSSEGIASSVKQLRKFEEFAQGDEADASPRSVKIDSGKRVIGIVKQGFTAQIRRPATGKPGRRPIIRALNTFKPIEPPAFALVKLGKKNKVVSSNVFIDAFADEQGLTNFSQTGDGQWMISTHSGNLYSVSIGVDPQQTNPELMTQLGPRTEQIAFCSARSSVVSISSFESDESGDQIIAPGSMFVAKMADLSSQTQTAASRFGTLSVSSSNSTGGKSGPSTSIRRPCNDKKVN